MLNVTASGSGHGAVTQVKAHNGPVEVPPQAKAFQHRHRGRHPQR